MTFFDETLEPFELLVYSDGNIYKPIEFTVYSTHDRKRKLWKRMFLFLRFASEIMLQ